MESYSRESDSRVSREDLLRSRPMPTFVGSEMTRFGFRELVIDNEANRLSLERIARYYKDTLAYEDRVDDILGKLLEPTVVEPGAEWFNREYLESIVQHVDSLLKGEYSLKNINAAIVLATGYYDVCRSDIVIYLEIIGDMDGQIRQYRNTLSHLEVEKNEPETLEQIAEEVAQITSFIQVSDESHQILIHEIEMSKRALQALYYISTLAC